MDFFGQAFYEVGCELIVFLVLVLVGSFIAKQLKNSHNRFLNPQEFLPEEEIHTLRQLGYLILLSMCFINIVYTFTFVEIDVFYFVIFDIVLSVYIAVTIDKDSWKNKILLFLLIPFGALNYVMFHFTLMGYLDIMHIPVFIYFMKYYYDRFMEYTRSNGLGIAILLLFVIIFFSFFATQITENKNALDSLVMVSNAFTSNGYAVLGNSIPGKINSIFLVWGGYIISGAGTATLTAAILIRHFNKRVEKLEKILNEEGE